MRTALHLLASVVLWLALLVAQGVMPSKAKQIPVLVDGIAYTVVDRNGVCRINAGSAEQQRQVFRLQGKDHAKRARDIINERRQPASGSSRGRSHDRIGSGSGDRIGSGSGDRSRSRPQPQPPAELINWLIQDGAAPEESTATADAPSSSQARLPAPHCLRSTRHCLRSTTR